MVGFDLETTAAEPEEARIVVAAVALCGGGEETVSRMWLVNPGIPIPEQASEIHGVTDEIAAEGEEPADAVMAIIDWIVEHLAGVPLVVFNGRYDLTVLDREARRYGIVPLQERTELRVVDPLVLDKHLDRYRPGSRKLEAICRALGAKADEAHDAAEDAIAACRTAWVLGAKGRIVRRAWNSDMEMEREALRREWEATRLDLGALHEMQIVWAREQALGLAEHFRETGNERAELVRTEWPVVPVSSDFVATID